MPLVDIFGCWINKDGDKKVKSIGVRWKDGDALELFINQVLANPESQIVGFMNKNKKESKHPDFYIKIEVPENSQAVKTQEFDDTPV